MSRQLTINDILKMFMAHIKLIVIMALVGTVLAFFYVSYFVTPVYSTSALILVQNGTGFSTGGSTADGDDDQKVNTSDITQSVMLANTCTELFMRDPQMKSIIAGNSVTISAVEETYFLEIKASSSDPLEAANVANQVAKAAPEVFANYFDDAGKVDTVDDAAIPSKPSSPNVKQFVIMGFLGGLILALGISFLIEIIDTTVKPDDDLYEIYKIPVFAEIIDFEVEGGAKR